MFVCKRTKINEKEAGDGPFFLKKPSYFSLTNSALKWFIGMRPRC